MDNKILEWAITYHWPSKVQHVFKFPQPQVPFARTLANVIAMAIPETGPRATEIEISRGIR